MAMKQLLIRVPDDVHRRLAARAAKEGRSLNAVATEMLDTAVDVVPEDVQSVLRARAAAAGLLRSLDAKPSTASDTPSLDEVRLALRSVALTAIELIDEQRGFR